MTKSPFSHDVKPDWEGLRRCIMREGTPDRVYHIELFLDGEIKNALCERYGVDASLDRDDPFFAERREIAVQRFLGYDHVAARLEDVPMPLKHLQTEDTAVLRREGGRSYMEEHRGPITNWDEFERYPWPDPEQASSRALEWYEENLPDDMCVIARGFAHYAEYLAWLMGYELYEGPEKRDGVWRPEWIGER